MTKRSHLVTLTTLALMAFVAAGCAADVGEATGALRLSRANYWVGTVESSTVRDGSLPPGADFRMDLYGPRPDGTYTGTVAQLAIPDWFVVGTRWPDGMVSLDGEHVSGDCVDTAVPGQISCELLVPGGRISVLMDESSPCSVSAFRPTRRVSRAAARRPTSRRVVPSAASWSRAARPSRAATTSRDRPPAAMTMSRRPRPRTEPTHTNSKPPSTDLVSAASPLRPRQTLA